MNIVEAINKDQRVQQYKEYIVERKTNDGQASSKMYKGGLMT